MSDFNTTAVVDAIPVHKYKKKSQAYVIWRRFKRNRMAMIGLVLFTIMLIVAITAPLYIDYDKDVITQTISMRYQGPSLAHPFGTDHFGRDIMSRVLWGARISMFVGVGVVAISLFIGSILGASAGYFGGVYDNVIMRIMDIVLAIPGTMLAITIVAALGGGIANLLLALGIEQVPKMTRIVRSSVLTLKRQDYIEAAKACGTGNVRIIFKHILPNAIGPILVQATLTVARTIISIAGLSFIGLGVLPPAPEWGAMISEAKTQLMNYPYLVYAPGIAIVLTVTSLTLIGDGLRDALDPKLKN
ncbi:ABC transporter permease [Lachnospiraceae bacterium NSJ-143]|nr:ABC transporter permease [Lachnospiraceae bacterium NSJ-143]